MSEPIHDPTVTLRLELGRVTDQRDAYQKALRKEVMTIIQEQIQVAVSEAVRDGFVDPMTYNLLNEDVESLSSTCERLTKENQFLKAEVERLKNNVAYLDRKLDEELGK